MIAIYTRNDDGTLERQTRRITRDRYLAILRAAALECGIPASLANKFEPAETEELVGWPEAQVTWYGSHAQVGVAEVA